MSLLQRSRLNSGGGWIGIVHGINNKGIRMCRNIKILYNFDPPVTDEEIRAAAMQYVRKVSGYNKPSQANETAFNAAIDAVAAATADLIASLVTNAPPKSRGDEEARRRASTV